MSGSSSSSGQSGGIGLCGLLGVVFITLKLCGVIGWHWAWVLAPFWMPLALVASILVGFLLIAGVMLVAVAIAERIDRKRRERTAARRLASLFRT